MSQRAVIVARSALGQLLIALERLFQLALPREDVAAHGQNVLGIGSVTATLQGLVDGRHGLVIVALAIVVAGDVVFGLGNIGAGGIVLEVALHLVDVGTGVDGSLLGGLKGEALYLVHVNLGSIGDTAQEFAEFTQLTLVGIDEFQVLGSGLSLVARGILLDDLLVGLDGGILLVHLLVDQSGLQHALAGLDALGIVLQQGGIGVEGIIVFAQQDLCVAFLEHCLGSQVTLGIGSDECVHLVDLVGILVVEAHHDTLLVHRIVTTGALVEAQRLVIGRLGTAEVLQVILSLADALIGASGQLA